MPLAEKIDFGLIMCPCGVRRATKTGWCTVCERQYGAEAWKSVGARGGGKDRPGASAAAPSRPPQTVAAVEGPASDAMAGPLAGAPKDRSATPEVAHHHEEETMVETAPERRYMLQSHQLTADDKERVRRLIRHMAPHPGFSTTTLDDLRAEIVRATDDGDGRGGLHIHGNALRALVAEALKPAKDAEPAKPPTIDAGQEPEPAVAAPPAAGLRIPPGPGDPTFAPCGCSLMKVQAGLCSDYNKDGTVRTAPAGAPPPAATTDRPPHSNGNGKSASQPAVGAGPAARRGEVFLQTERGALRGGPQPDGSFRLAITAHGLCAAEFHALLATGHATVLGLTPEQGGHRVA